MFNQVQFRKPPKNVFNLSHERKFSMKMGQLVPILCEEIIPGDSFKINAEVLMRMAPMLAPVMHRVNVFTHFFFVPNRLVWNEWESFITGGEDGLASPVIPYLDLVTSLPAGSLGDFLGCATPSGETVPARVNALPFRAYQMIYNEYYRDQNLEDKIDFGHDSGEAGGVELAPLRTRAWEKDYFTSALPWTQRGGEVQIPLLGDAPVIMNDVSNATGVYTKSGANPSEGTTLVTKSDGGGPEQHVSNSAESEYFKFDPNGTLEADLSAVTNTTITELRNAVKLQEWLEKNARGGSRYIEQLKQHFGVTSSDARLQRPEYLGGSKNPVIISEVLQTSESATSPQANMAGHGVSAGNSPSFNRSFEEHGYIIGIVSVLPKTTYQQGFRRHLLKNDKFQYYWPEFAHIGEQEVMKSELYHDFSTAVDKDAFGYQSRYSEYKFIPSSVHGDFKNTLNYWHMGRIFDSLPNLNADFIHSDPTNRIFAVIDESDKLYVQVYNNIKAIRPISRFSNPQL